jgi:hypothetical protein
MLVSYKYLMYYSDSTTILIHIPRFLSLHTIYLGVTEITSNHSEKTIS